MAAITILRGFDDKNALTFTAARDGQKLAVFDTADIKAAARSTVRLEFTDPDDSARPLFVLPVLPTTLRVELKTQAKKLTIDGRMRSLMPPALGERLGSCTFDFEIVPAAATVVEFGKFAFGPIRAAVISITNTGLTKAPLAATSSPIDTWFKVMGLKYASGVTNRPWVMKFVAAPAGTTTYARLHLQLETDVPVEKIDQHFAPFGVDVKKRHWPGTFPRGLMRVRQSMPMTKEAAFRHWMLSLAIPQRSAVHWWHRFIVTPVLQSLATIQEGRPFTTLPWVPNRGPTSWDAWCQVLDNTLKIELDQDDVAAGLPSGPLDAKALIIVPLLLTPAATLRPKRITLPALKTVDGEMLHVLCSLLPLELPQSRVTTSSELEDAPVSGFKVQPLQSSPQSTGIQVARMGALDLAFPPSLPMPQDPVAAIDPAPLEDRGVVSAVIGYERIAKGFSVNAIVHRRCDLMLPVRAVRPGAQDDEAGADFLLSMSDSEFDQDADMSALLAPTRPLVINLAPPTDPATQEIPFRFESTETLQRGVSQTIQAQLHRSQAGAATPLIAMIVDDQPFTACIVDAGTFEQDLALGTEIANWSNRPGENAWEIRASQRAFDLILPPQGIGEAMHRRADDDDVVPGKPIDFRFTPPTRVRLRAGDLLQRFNEPGWNLRRLLHQPRFLSGAAVEALDFELFYGVAGHLAPRGLRLSEMTARFGQTAGLLPQRPHRAGAYDDIRRRWAFLLRGIRTRLAVYELWDPVRELTGTIESLRKPLSVSDAEGLRFELRPTAKLRYPIKGAQQKPLNEGATGAKRFVDFSEDGLAGGWSWGFESRNVLEAVRARPDSTSGSLTGLFLSALGGWGVQKASFDNDRTTIYSTVEMGRTSTINIERIGRIGVLWNRAKHVIVYERTVAPSRQFYLEQHQLLGNPVLRKVDEYIELIDDERGFPDNDAPLATRGFILGCRFAGGKPARIRVNSKWGHDIGDTGWKIPLWKRGAIPADVYPKPSISLLSAGIRSDERVPLGIDDPEQLCFYTSTRPDLTSDTDAWPSVEGVDFQIVSESALRPPPLRPPTDPAQLRDPEYHQVKDRLMTPELGAFTFALEPAPGPANLVIDRSAEVIRGLPRSVTLLRGFQKGVSAFTTPAAALLQGHLANAFAPIRQPGGRLSPAEIKAAVLEEINASLKPAVNTVVEQLTKGEFKLCGALSERIAKQFDAFAAETRLQIVSALHVLRGEYLARIDEAFAGGDVIETRGRLRGALADLAEGVGGARQAITSARGTVGEVIAALEALEETLQETAVAAGDMVSSTALEIADLPDWSAASQEAAQRHLQQLATQWERYVLPGPVDFAIGEAVRSWLGQGIDKLSHALADRRERLPGVLATIAGNVSTATQEETVEAILSLADQVAEVFIDTIDQIQREWIEPIDPLAITPVEGALNDLTAVIRTSIDTIDDLTKPETYRAALTAPLNDYFDGLGAKLDALLPMARAELVTHAQQLCKLLYPTPAELGALLNRLLDASAFDFLDGPDTTDFRERVDALLARLANGMAALVDRARMVSPKVPPIELPDGIMRLVRAFGDVPRLPSLEFKLPQIGYYFYSSDGSLPLPAIDLSPIVGYANQLGKDVLNAIDIKLPATKLLDRLIPPSLDNFDLSKLFPNFAGLRLDSLFKNVSGPGGTGNIVRVSHGVNPETQSAWLRADVDVKLTQRTTVFEVAGAKLSLTNAKMTAYSRIDARVGESPRQRSAGSISGDWTVEAGGMPIADLADATLRFDEEGRIHFDVSPAQVKLKAPLDFVSRLLEPFSSSKDGFAIAVTPTAIRTSLFLPLPNIQGGTFGIAYLSLGFLFELQFLPEFVIRTALLLSRPEKPFTLTVFILGGAGSLRFGVAYKPATGIFTTELDVELYASASLAVSLGPVSGGLYAYVGVAVAYSASSNGASSLYYGIRILFIGEVCVLGIISVNITLGMEAGYRGNQLIGTGFVSLRIKVAWFLTISVSASVTYEFGSGETTSQSQQQIESAADDYLAMF